MNLKQIVVSIGVIGLTACGLLAAPTKVIVSIVPQVDFVKSIGGDAVEVVTLIPSGASPEVFEPTPKTMKQIAAAEVFFMVGGLPFESVIAAKIKLINPKIIQKIQFSSDPHDHSDHSHAHNPHYWMDPAAVSESVSVITTTLIALNPTHKSQFKKNQKEFVNQLKLLDRSIQKQLSLAKHRSYLIYHPFMTHFNERYNLSSTPIEYEGKAPTAKYLKTIVQQSKSDKIRLVVTQKQTDSSMVQFLADTLNAKILVLDPLKAGYIDNMTEISTQLAEAL